MLKIYACLLGIVLQTYAPPVFAQIYKWTDAQGKIHYTDRASDASGGRSTEVKVAPAPLPDAARPAQDWRAQEAAYKRRHPVDTTPAPYVPPVFSNRAPANTSKDPWVRDKCAMAQNVLRGRSDLNNRSAAEPKDRKTATSDVSAYCR